MHLGHGDGSTLSGKQLTMLYAGVTVYRWTLA